VENDRDWHSASVKVPSSRPEVSAAPQQLGEQLQAASPQGGDASGLLGQQRILEALHLCDSVEALVRARRLRADAKTLLAPQEEAIAPIRGLPSLGDAAQASHRVEGRVASHRAGVLGGDGHHADASAPLEGIGGQLPVARLEDVEGDPGAREENDLCERKQRYELDAADHHPEAITQPRGLDAPRVLGHLRWPGWGTDRTPL
jgi:hypothetical protein